MGRNKISLDFTEFIDLLERLEELEANLPEIVEEALDKSFDIVTPKIEQAIAKNNLPAHGKYSQGDTERSLTTTKKITWERTSATINVGFEFKKSGLTSIFLIYGTEVKGTPRMKPVAGLKDALYGDATKKEIQEVQRDILQKAIEKAVNGS